MCVVRFPAVVSGAILLPLTVCTCCARSAMNEIYSDINAPGPARYLCKPSGGAHAARQAQWLRSRSDPAALLNSPALGMKVAKSGGCHAMQDVFLL